MPPKEGASSKSRPEPRTLLESSGLFVSFVRASSLGETVLTSLGRGGNISHAAGRTTVDGSNGNFEILPQLGNAASGELMLHVLGSRGAVITSSKLEATRLHMRHRHRRSVNEHTTSVLREERSFQLRPHRGLET